MNSEFQSAAGKVYHLSPLTLGDMRQFRLYVQYLPYHEVAEHKEDFPADKIDSLLEELFRECSKRKITADDVNEVFSSNEGTLELVYLSLKRNHEKITRREVAEILTPFNMLDVLHKLQMISGLAEPQEEESKKNEVTPS